MILYNIYYGTIGKILGIRYRFTKNCKNENEALKIAENAASTLYYKNEGKYGIPTFTEISEESKITGIPLETLYNSHIKDMTRFFVIPTEIDTISSKNIVF